MGFCAIRLFGPFDIGILGENCRYELSKWVGECLLRVNIHREVF